MPIIFDHATRAIRGSRDHQEDTALVAVGERVWCGGAGALTLASPANGRREDHRSGAASGAEPGAEPARGSAAALTAALADGMGGHVGGALASRIVCETFVDASRKGSGMRERLSRGLYAANEALAHRISVDRLLSGMGSTLVGAIVENGGLHWVSIGDSLLLLWRRGELVPLNEDHSLAPELDRLVAAGKLTPNEARNDPRRHMLRSAVMGDELDLVDISQAPLLLEPDDCIVLASDGLHALEYTEITRIVAGYSADGPDAVAKAMIRAVEAVRDPHQDNTTIIVIQAIAAPEKANPAV